MSKYPRRNIVGNEAMEVDEVSNAIVLIGNGGRALGKHGIAKLFYRKN